MPAPNAASNFHEPTIVAIDWSGARNAAAQRQAIATAVVSGGQLDVSSGRTREETVEFLRTLPAPLVVGFDFSFSVPAWACQCRQSTTAVDLWSVVEREGEQWLDERASPFHGWERGDRLAGVELFRVTERRLKAKSTFQANGKGTVGTGSIRGIPHLIALRAAGFSVWPFDDATERTIVEIYPTALRRMYSGPRRTHASEHERDATESALVMWKHRDELLSLRAATDPITRLEGDVWVPAS